MSCVWMSQRGHSGDGCVLASTLCKYDLRKGDLFVLSWARVRRARRGSISSELLVCGGGVRSILPLPPVAPNDTAYKRWSCHNGFKLLCKLCRTSPPPAMGARFTHLGSSPLSI